MEQTQATETQLRALWPRLRGLRGVVGPQIADDSEAPSLTVGVVREMSDLDRELAEARRDAAEIARRGRAPRSRAEVASLDDAVARARCG